MRRCVHGSPALGPAPPKRPVRRANVNQYDSPTSPERRSSARRSRSKLRGVKRVTSKPAEFGELLYEPGRPLHCPEYP